MSNNQDNKTKGGDAEKNGGLGIESNTDRRNAHGSIEGWTI